MPARPAAESWVPPPLQDIFSGAVSENGTELPDYDSDESLAPSVTTALSRTSTR